MDLKGLEDGGLGQLIQTGWRKGHDSDWSAVVWNLVYVINDDVWMVFIREVTKELQTCETFDGKALAEAYRRGTETIMDMREEGKERYAKVAFACAIGMASTSDLVGDVAWLKHCLGFKAPG